MSSLSPPIGFAERRTHTHTWWLKDDLEDALFQTIAHVNNGNGEPLQGGRGGVQRIPFDEQGCAIVRHYRRGGLVRHLIRDFYWDRPFRPFAELYVTLAARERGVPTVEILGAGVEKKAFGFYRGLLITREATGFANWWEWLQTKPPQEKRKETSAKILQTISTMHDAGIYHADLNVTNILVEPGSSQPEVLIIDFDRARLSSSALHVSQRKRNLARLQRSITKLDPEKKFFYLS